MLCELVIGSNSHKTHVDGKFYQMPYDFPVVLHDRQGCVRLPKEKYDELVKFNTIRESRGGKQEKINITRGISSINGYKVCDCKSDCPYYRPRKP